MPVLTTIDGIPLFSTVAEALSWAAANGLSGYHTHTYQGQTGYMGGINHASATQGPPPQAPSNINVSGIISPSSGGGGSGGGGGGY
tara:strand:- start:351 stop:608 length:258 start_codon:yes stop_codon:yes gene_type:complete